MQVQPLLPKIYRSLGRLPSQQSLRAYKAYEDSTQLAEACKLQVAEVSRLGACWTALQVFSFRCLVFSHLSSFYKNLALICAAVPIV